jgi:endogenous inhibitor of DNA gyrase (YacG/DUF329 family)
MGRKSKDSGDLTDWIKRKKVIPDDEQPVLMEEEKESQEEKESAKTLPGRELEREADQEKTKGQLDERGSGDEEVIGVFMGREEGKDSGDLGDWIGKEKEVPDNEKETIVGEEQKIQKAQETEKKRVKTPRYRERKRDEDDITPLGISLPEGVYGHFLLIDIAPPVKDIRGIPQYIQIKTTRALIGSYVKAHIRLDDQRTIKTKHAKVIYEERDGKKEFSIYPIDDAPLSVNGKIVSSVGIVLKSGDRVKIGSADLIFFHKDLKQKQSKHES